MALKRCQRSYRQTFGRQPFLRTPSKSNLSETCSKLSPLGLTLPSSSKTLPHSLIDVSLLSNYTAESGTLSEPINLLQIAELPYRLKIFDRGNVGKITTPAFSA